MALISPIPRAPSSRSSASDTESPQYAWGVGEPLGGLLDGSTILITLTQLALAHGDDVRAQNAHSAPHALFAPQVRLRWMLVQEEPSRSCLLGVELAHEDQVDDCFPPFFAEYRRIFGSSTIDPLPGAELGAHRAPDEQIRLGLVYQPLRLLPNVLLREVPWLSVLITTCDIKGSACLCPVAGALWLLS